MCARARRLAVLPVVIVMVALAQPLDAQTVVDPKTAEFNPSPDHDATADGKPVVDRYELDFYVQGAAQPFQTLNLGKPAPGGDGKIRLNFAVLLTSPLAPGTIYNATVAAVGPWGRSSSAPAPESFSFTVPCSFAASPANPLSLAASGGSAIVAVTTTAGCAWMASESSSWLSIAGGASGTGNGTVSYTVTANTTTSPRSTTMTVAGQTITITQDAASCVFAASPMNPPSLATSGGSASVTVTTIAGCAWTASESSSWLSITSGASDTGNGTVSYTATANTSTTPRSATLTVAGQTVTVTQDAAPCVFTASPTNPPSLASSGGSASVAVTAPAGCAWTASESSSWLSITSAASGTGNSTVVYTATANTTTSPRSATLTVAGQTIAVTQDAAPCTFTVLPATPAIAPNGGSTAITVTTTAGCTWTASESSSWLSITSGASGSGTSSVTVTASANGTGSARSATLTIAGQSVTVTQSVWVPGVPTNLRIVPGF